MCPSDLWNKERKRWMLSYCCNLAQNKHRRFSFFFFSIFTKYCIPIRWLTYESLFLLYFSFCCNPHHTMKCAHGISIFMIIQSQSQSQWDNTRIYSLQIFRVIGQKSFAMIKIGLLWITFLLLVKRIIKWYMRKVSLKHPSSRNEVFSYEPSDHKFEHDHKVLRSCSTLNCSSFE